VITLYIVFVHVRGIQIRTSQFQCGQLTDVECMKYATRPPWMGIQERADPNITSNLPWDYCLI
jgi:hypothetical protein